MDNSRFFDILGMLPGTIMGSTAYHMSGADIQNRFSAEQAQLDRDFQERMSNTAYQRAAADMKAAGVNPATLSGLATGGSTSVPSGASATANGGQSVLPAVIGALSKFTSSVISAAGNIAG